MTGDLVSLSTFTEDPTLPPTVVFPNPEMQALACVIFLTGESEEHSGLLHRILLLFSLRTDRANASFSRSFMSHNTRRPFFISVMPKRWEMPQADQLSLLSPPSTDRKQVSRLSPSSFLDARWVSILSRQKAGRTTARLRSSAFSSSSCRKLLIATYGERRQADGSVSDGCSYTVLV